MDAMTGPSLLTTGEPTAGGVAGVGLVVTSLQLEVTNAATEYKEAISSVLRFVTAELRILDRLPLIKERQPRSPEQGLAIRGWGLLGIGKTP